MPESFRSPRKRALEIGTKPQGFTDQIDYDAMAGVPKTPGMPIQKYDAKRTPSGAGKPSQGITPFNLKGGAPAAPSAPAPAAPTATAAAPTEAGE